MSVSPQDVEKVALLARLTISESDLPEVTERFARVLGLVDELNTIDTQDVVPMSNPHDMEQRLRPDAVTRSNEREAVLHSEAVAGEVEALELRRRQHLRNCRGPAGAEVVRGEEQRAQPRLPPARLRRVLCKDTNEKE